MKARQRLREQLFGDEGHPLFEPLSGWLDDSRRFAAFADANLTKIRKKLRSTLEPESLRDLALELETAYLLHRERNFSVTYEPRYGGGHRAPDFVVSYTSSVEFAVEVTRLSAAPEGLALATRLVSLVPAKLGQLLADNGNVLVVGVAGDAIGEVEARAALNELQRRAETGGDAFLDRHGFRDRKAFFRQLQRLSALLLRGAELWPQGSEAVVVENPQAHRPLPRKVVTALARSHGR